MMLILGLIVLISFLFFYSFLASLHWPQDTSDLGKFGISYFELLLMFEVYTGHRLQTEKTVRLHLRSRRPLAFSGFFCWNRARNLAWLSISPQPFQGFGSSSWWTCSFYPLSTLGWGRYGHGLSCRPRESCDHQFLTPLLNFFGYPDGAVT